MSYRQNPSFSFSAAIAPPPHLFRILLHLVYKLAWPLFGRRVPTRIILRPAAWRFPEQSYTGPLVYCSEVALLAVSITRVIYRVVRTGRWGI